VATEYEQSYYVDNVFIQRLDSDGIPVYGPAGINVGDNSNRQSHPAVSADDEGGVYIVWRSIFDDQNIYYDLGVRALHLDANGEPADPVWSENGNFVTSITWEQYYPTIIADGQGGAITAWDDRRSGGANPYMRRIYEPGTPVHDQGIPSPPVEFSITPPHPNPFNPMTIISFDILVSSKVKLEVFDVRGRLVQTWAWRRGFIFIG